MEIVWQQIFFRSEEETKEDLIDYSMLTSLCDSTPEGKSIVALANKMGTKIPADAAEQVEFVEFTAQTKMSGVNLPDGRKVRKGASEAMKAYVTENGGTIPEDLDEDRNRGFEAGRNSARSMRG